MYAKQKIEISTVGLRWGPRVDNDIVSVAVHRREIKSILSMSQEINVCLRL